MHYVYAGPLERDISQYFRPQTSWQMDWQSEVSSFSGNRFPRIIAMSWSASSLFEVFFLFLQFFLPNVKLIVKMTWRAEMIKKLFFFKYPGWEETNDYRTSWPPRYVRRNRKGRRGDKRGSGGWQADLVKVRGKEVLGFDDDGDDVALSKVGGKGDFVFDGGGDGEHIALPNRQEDNYRRIWGCIFSAQSSLHQKFRCWCLVD